MITYKYKGVEYEIDDPIAQQILDDFLYCESIGDWKTIKNRMINGIKFEWLRKINQ